MTTLFIQWLYVDAPAAFWEYRRQLAIAFYSFFSIPLLFKTLFDPWRHDAVDVSRLPVRARFEAWANNMISRIIGMTLRLWAISTGFGLIAAVSMGTLIFVIAWYLMPLLLLASLAYGIGLLVGL